MSDVVQATDLSRACIADAHGHLDHPRSESSAASFMKIVWYTICRSVYDTLQEHIAKTVDLASS